MLDTMRNLSKGIASKFLIGLLVLSFAVWGIGDIFTNSGPNYAAKVGGQTIGLNEFQQQRSLVMRQLEALNIKDLPAGQIELSVIQQLVQQNLTLQAMHDMGLDVNDALVKNAILNAPEFKDKDGTFSGELFKAMIDQQNLTEAGFVKQLKHEIAGRFLIDSLVMADASTPSSVLTLDALVQNETRDAVLFTIPAGAATKAADEAALQAFYEENKNALYLQAETRTLEYVVLTDANINQLVAAAAGETKATDDAARREARDRVMQELGNRIEDELASGKTMAEAFTKAGVNTSPRTLENAKQALASSSSDDVTKTVVEQGFSLSEGEISRLIRSKQGALLMVSAKKINQAAPNSFDAVKADVASRLAKQQSLDGAREKALSVKAALGKEPNWQAVANENGLSTRAVSRLKRPAGASAAENAVMPAALQQAIFERKLGEVAGPLTRENGDQLLALVTAAQLPKMDPKTLTTGNAKTAEKLSGEVENRALQSFSTKHKVTVNPALLRQSSGQE